MLITKNLEREKNKVVNTFVNTVTEAEIPEELLSKELPENAKDMEAFFKAQVQAELDKPAYQKAFTAQEKSEAVELFTKCLQRGVSLKKMSDGFRQKMNGGDYQATAEDLTDIENFFEDDKYNSKNNDVRNKLAKAMKNVDIRNPEMNSNILSLISKTAKGLSFFNCTIEANLKVQESEMVIADDIEVDAAMDAASKANNGVYNRLNKNELDNEELLQEYTHAAKGVERYLNIVGEDFEQTVFTEDIELMQKKLNHLDDLRKSVTENVRNWANPYKKMENVEKWKEITNQLTDPKSPFYVPEALDSYRKKVINSESTNPPSPTKAEKAELNNYLQKLNSKLEDYGYHGPRLTTIPKKAQRAKLLNTMEMQAKEDVRSAEEKGYTEKAFTDMKGYLEDLSDQRAEIVNSPLAEKIRALELAKDKQEQAAKYKLAIEARNRAASANQRAVDAIQKSETSRKNAGPSIFANETNISAQLSGLFDRLGDKSSFFHVDSSSFRKMKNGLKRMKDHEDYLNQLGDDNSDNYSYHMKKGAISNPQDFVKALQEVHDSAVKYLEEKGKQKREKPSEMRLARLEAANEIVKLSEAYLKAHNTLESNGKTIKGFDNTFHHIDASSNLDFYQKNAQTITMPNVKEVKLPKVQKKPAAVKQAAAEKVQEKKQVKESAPAALQ